MIGLPAITTAQLAALRAGLWSSPKSPEWEMAHRVLDSIEGKHQAAMPPDVAKAWMAILCAPAGLKAAEGTISILRRRIEALEARAQVLGAGLDGVHR